MGFTPLPGEQEFLDEVLRNPDDEGARLIYADWLEERGDGRAEYLRVEVQLGRVSDGTRRASELRDELRRLTGKAHSDWIPLIARTAIGIPYLNYSVESCCPSRWERLSLTARPDVRICNTCRRKVYFCRSRDEIHRARRRRIAIDAALDPWNRKRPHTSLDRRTRESPRRLTYPVDPDE